MAFSEDLLAQRNKLQNEILALESSLGDGSNLADLLSSDGDSDEESVDSGHAGEVVVAPKDLEAERNQIQREIEELERTLGADAALVDDLTDSEHGSPVISDSDDDLDLPQDMETCLQMNLVYQEVLQEKLADVERLLNENREQQKELEEQLSGPSYVYSGLPHLKLFLGSFMKPYFKDKLTGLGPPANEETKERLSHGTKPCDEMKIRRWEPWQKTLLINSVVTDTMKRMLQPKLSKIEYLTAKMSKAENAEKEEIQHQIDLLENDISKISSLKEDQLYGDRHDDHDWDKISNIDFEGLRQPDDLMRFWQNYLHPSINKSTWSQDEIAKLTSAAEEHNWCNWEQIAKSLGTGRTAFMCFQTYQRYISKKFRKREWSKEEDNVFLGLVEKMRIGNFIPYTQISYFMEGRDSSQLLYRWTCVLDPSIKKGPWTKDEDKLLLKAVKKYGCKEWWKIRLEVPGRTDSSCRDRYLDCLQANIKRGAWSEEEVELLKILVEKHGVGKWSKIAAEIPNRVDSQCLNKWKWMTQKAQKEAVKRVMGEKREEPQSKKKRTKRSTRRRTKQQTLSESKDDDFHTLSDTSEDENEQVSYMDINCEEEGEADIISKEGCKLEYVQPDMKEWIPACEGNLEHSKRKVKTISVRLPSEAEESARGNVRNTVLDRLGKPVKTYVGMEPPAFEKNNLSSERIMVSKIDVTRFLISMRSSVKNARKLKSKDGLSSCPNQKDDRNVAGNKTCTMERGQKRKLYNELMIAITPWVGNVIMPLPFNERQVCEVDIVGKRAADVSLVKTPVFLLFLQALKIDTDGCKKVIQARNDRMSMTPRPDSRPSPAKNPTPSSSRIVKTVGELLVKKNRAQREKQSNPLQLFGPQLPPQPAKIPIPPQPRWTGKPKQSASKKIDAAWILPKTDNKAVTIHNVQGNLPVLQLGTKDCFQVPQPVLHLAIPVESEMGKQKESCSTISNGLPTKTSGEVGSAKRKHKPTIKAQVLMSEEKNKLSKKQAAKKQQITSLNQTVSVLPQTTAWIITTAGLMPVAGLQIQAPGIPSHEKQVINKTQMVFQPPVTTNQSKCVSPTNVKTPSNPSSNLPENIAGSYLVLDNHVVSSLPSSNFPSVLSITNMTDTNVPTSAVQSSKSANPKSSIVLSSSVGISQSLTTSCNTDANKVSVTTTSSVTSDSGTVPSPQGQKGPHPVSQPVFQQPIVINQNGFMTVNTAGPFQTNASLAATANVTMVPTTFACNNSLPTSANPPISPVTVIQQPMPQTMQKETPQSKTQTVQNEATLVIPEQMQISSDTGLMFFEQPDEVKKWMNCNGGITLPGLENKMPYLPPFISSINTMTTLLKGRDSLLKSAVQILPEEHRNDSDDDAKIAAVRKMVSERFKSNQAYLLLKARFLSCFTLPALLATIKPCEKSSDAPDETDGIDKVKPKQFGDNQFNTMGSLLNGKESELTATQYPGRQARKQTDSHKIA